jgi:hypothetical protein
MTEALLRVLARGEWGRAMRAELAAIEDMNARRRFALGCVRALLTRPQAWAQVASIALVAAVPALLLAGPGRGEDVAEILIVVGVTVACLAGVAHADVSASALAGGLVWWAALLLSPAVRAHPHWALVVIAAAALASRRRALGTALVTCLAVFVASVGTYAVLPRLAPNVVPVNAADPVVENQIESTDPYVGEFLLAGLLGIAVAGAVRVRPAALPG